MPLYYTRTGDKGDTGLFGTDKRVSKADLRIEVNGEVDELQSFVGLVRAVAKEKGDKKTNDLLKQVQEDLFILSADVASPSETKISRISEDHVKWLEQNIDTIGKELPALKNFIFPGGSRLAALLHICRTIARRAGPRRLP